MLRLNLKKEPYWLEMPAGVRLRVRPLSTAVMSAAQASVIKQINAMRAERDEAGDEIGDMPDITREDTRAGVAEALFIRALARSAIVTWEGITVPDSDAPAPVNETTIGELMDIWFIAQDFWKQYTDSLSLLEAEGNASRPVAHGTFPAGLNTAEDATSKDSPAAPLKVAS